MHLQQPARTRIPTQQEFSPRDSSLDGLTAAWWAFPLCKLQRNCQQGWGENYFIARRDGAHTNAKTKQTHQQKGTLIETLSILTQVYRNCGWSFLGDYHTTGGGGGGVEDSGRTRGQRVVVRRRKMNIMGEFHVIPPHMDRV